MQLAVIGPGTMGLMSAVRLVKQGLCPADGVRLSRVSAERRARIESALPGAHLLSDNVKAADGADLVILAVKPWQFEEVAGALRGHIAKDALVISVMTALDLRTLSERLGVPGIARAATNIGIEAGVATTYWIAAPEASDAHRDLARSVFRAWGEGFECALERLLDVAMVGVGSGPALVLEFARALTEAMEANGMPADLAEQGVLSLMGGTAALVRGGGRSPAEFQKSVVTPGGITAEALQSMSENKFRDIVVKAFQKALDKTSRLAEPGKK